jgi:hypothetical protein
MMNSDGVADLIKARENSTAVTGFPACPPPAQGQFILNSARELERRLKNKKGQEGQEGAKRDGKLFAPSCPSCPFLP